jgi:hypothetical protein
MPDMPVLPFVAGVLDSEREGYRPSSNPKPVPIQRTSNPSLLPPAIAESSIAREK